MAHSPTDIKTHSAIENLLYISASYILAAGEASFREPLLILYNHGESAITLLEVGFHLYLRFLRIFSSLLENIRIRRLKEFTNFQVY